MSNPSALDENRPAGSSSETPNEPAETFGDILSEYEQPHSHKPEGGAQGLRGTVIQVTSEAVMVYIGFKTEGIVPRAAFESAGETVDVGEKIAVSVNGRDPEGYYEQSEEHTSELQSH